MVDLFGLMNLVDVSIISAALGVLAGVINSIFASRRAERQRQTEIETRQAQLFMQIHEQWKDRAFIKGFYEMLNKWEWKDFDDFLAKYGQSSNEEAFITMTEVVWYFEGVGQLLREGLIDIGLVEAMYSDRTIKLWEKGYPIVLGLRELYRNPDYYGNFEYLYREMKKSQVKPSTPATRARVIPTIFNV